MEYDLNNNNNLDTIQEALDEIDRRDCNVSAAMKVLEIQGSKGNWDYDPYMHGMYNGLELGIKTILGETPKSRYAPKKWTSFEARLVDKIYPVIKFFGKLRDKFINWKNPPVAEDIKGQ